MSDTSDSKIHLTKAPCLSLAFLAYNRNVLPVSSVTLYEFYRLYKHTTGTATGVINNPAVWFNHFGNEFNNTGRSVELTIFLGSCGGICLKKVFINTTDKVFLMETFLVDEVNIIN
jgi:hypothetical protein